jgi:flavin reductase (DIM6/NTAB) family NADH-FMN oxidoreductase RutF
MAEKISPPRKVWDRLFATPGILGLITTVDAKGAVNTGAYATCLRAVHNPVQISFVTDDTNDTNLNIKETGEFVVNLPSFNRDLLAKVCTVGLPFARDVNELEKAGLTALPSTALRPPRIAECNRHFECKVVWTKEWGNRVMVMGEVVAASIDKDCVDADGFLLWDIAFPALYCGAPYANQPPYQNRFVAAYETTTVEPYGNYPEVEGFRQKLKKLDI